MAITMNESEMDFSQSLTGDIHQLNELLSNFTSSQDDSDDDEQLPNSLYVKNVDMEVFNHGELTKQFENLFKVFDSSVQFQYFRSFKMVRIYFSNGHAAASARVQCHQRKIGNSNINCYFTQHTTKTNGNGDIGSDRLQPPKPMRQFLISPPASPPVGWEPAEENTPIINFELIEALSKLTPGKAHELHPPSEDQPAIVVHICEEDNSKSQLNGEEAKDSSDDVDLQNDSNTIAELAFSFRNKVKIQQTRCPPSYLRSTSEGSDDSIDSI